MPFYYRVLLEGKSYFHEGKSYFVETDASENEVINVFHTWIKKNFEEDLSEIARDRGFLWNLLEFEDLTIKLENEGKY